eukprot:346978-Rhodomonas_salina.3
MACERNGPELKGCAMMPLPGLRVRVRRVHGNITRPDRQHKGLTDKRVSGLRCCVDRVER